MRLTLRILLSMMSALETALDEIHNKMRDDKKYADSINAVRKSQKATRTLAVNLLNAMIDDGRD